MRNCKQGSGGRLSGDRVIAEDLEIRVGAFHSKCPYSLDTGAVSIALLFTRLLVFPSASRGSKETIVLPFNNEEAGSERCKTFSNLTQLWR